MKKENDMQFLIKDAMDDLLVLRELNSLLGFSLESVDHPIPGAVGMLIVEHHRDGFAMSFLAMWPDQYMPKGTLQEIAVELAKALNVEILLDIDRREFGDDWLLIRSDGSTEKANTIELEDGIDVEK